MIPRYCPIVLFALISALLSACSFTEKKHSYQAETFASETPFQYYSSRDPEGACQTGVRALLSQGYQVDQTKPREVHGEKFFRPQPDHASTLSITLVCLPSSLGAVVYANALETQYEMKAKGVSAGVSVAAIGSVSLPWAMDKDTLVKTGEETVIATGFYQRLFELIRSLEN